MKARFYSKRVCLQAAGQVGALIVVLAMVPPARAQEDPVARAKRIYGEKLIEIGLAHKDGERARLTAYGEFIDAVMTRFQQRGDFDATIALRTEKARFEAARSVPESPPSDVHPVVIAIQSSFHDACADAEVERSRAVLQLAERYGKKLEDLKKQLTIQGNLVAALAAKQELEELPDSPAVKTAKRKVTEAEGEAAVSALLEGESEMTACPRCNGTGRVPKQCPACGGSGRCPRCGGRGDLPPRLKGSYTRSMCLMCKGKGDCPTCAGKGQVSVECRHCRGTGKVKRLSRPAPAPDAAPLAVIRPRYIAPSPPAAGGQPEPGSGADSGLLDYVETVSGLYKRYLTGTPEDAGIRDVVARPAGYMGKLLRSTARLVNGFPRNVRVVPPDGPVSSAGDLLIPHTLGVGLAANRIFKEHGPGCEVTLVYGVVNEENRTLFQISAADNALPR